MHLEDLLFWFSLLSCSTEGTPARLYLSCPRGALWVTANQLQLWGLLWDPSLLLGCGTVPAVLLLCLSLQRAQGWQ